VSMDVGVGAVGVSLWGMANWGNWVYNVTIDGGSANSCNGSTFVQVPDAMLFYQGGLDPTKNHTVTLTNTSPKMKLALNSMRVYRVASTSTVTSSSGTSVVPTPSASATSVPKAHSNIGAGVVAGPIIGVLLLGLLGGFLWWRSRRNRLSAPTHPDLAQSDKYNDRAPHRPFFPSTGYTDATSTTALTPAPLSPTYSVPSTHVSGPPGATVMTWGAAPYHDDDTRSQTGISSTHAHSTTTRSTYAHLSDGTASDRPVLTGKMRPTTATTPPPPPPTGLDAPDVDRLIELIAQRIDRGRGNDETAPPEYRG